MIGWVLVRRSSVVSKNMRHLGFRRFLLPLVDQDIVGTSPKLMTLTQVTQGMVCAYMVLILLGWVVFHANAGYYYQQLAHYLIGLFPGLNWT